MRGRVATKQKQCTACRSCELACAVAHSQSQDLLQAMSEDPKPLSRVKVTMDEKGATRLVRCQHCRKPKCVEACPVDAITQTEDGLVLIDQDKCTACESCVAACPFGAVWLLPDGSAAYKCDLCVERLNRDELPACVEACPTGALLFRHAEVEVVSGE